MFAKPNVSLLNHLNSDNNFPRRRTVHRVNKKYPPTRRNERSCTMTPARRIPPITNEWHRRHSKNPARRAHREQRRGDNLLRNCTPPRQPKHPATNHRPQVSRVESIDSCEKRYWTDSRIIPVESTGMINGTRVPAQPQGWPASGEHGKASR